MKKWKVYLQLFSTAFQLSAFTFGGGFVIIPLMRKKFVDQLHWLKEDEMLDMTAIAQSAPGAIAVNPTLLVGYRVAGIPGAFITVLGTVLPPLITLSVISFFYAAFRSNPVVNLVMKGMAAGVAAVVFDVVFTMVHSLFREKRLLYPILLAGAFIAACIFKVNVILISLVCGIVGALNCLRNKQKNGGGSDVVS